MPVKSAMRGAVTVVTTVITVAAGVFAPGHLGELTRMIPFELVDAILDEEGCTEKRVRLLPSRVGVYFLLAMCLFPDPSYLQVWGKLTAGLRALGLARVSETALRDLRRRVGFRPLKRLFEVLAGPLGQPGTPGVMYRGYRLVSFDGMKSVKAPDTESNRAWLGKQNASNGETGYPAVSLMALVEDGTRSVMGADFGPAAGGETGQASGLLHLLDESMLLLGDRGFDSGPFLAAVHAAKAQFLIRLTATRKPRVIKRLPDGTYLSLIGGVKVRIITARVTVTCHDGSTYGDRYRLATTLLDYREHPAAGLVTLYHQRWEHEITYLALRHTLLGGRVLRSQDPAGIEQEMWTLLALYQALRRAVTDAVETVPGLDPDRANWTAAVEAARDLVITAQNITDPGGTDLAGEIGRAALDSRHGPRRPRVCPRKVKSPLSRWNKHPAGKPRTIKRIKGIASSIIPAFPAPAGQDARPPAGGNPPAGTGACPAQCPARHAPHEPEAAEAAEPPDARHAAGPGEHAGAPAPAAATPHAKKDARRRPSAARRPQTPPRHRPRPRSQAKHRVAVTTGITESGQVNTRSRMSSRKIKPGEPLDAEPDPLTAWHCG